jgi:hypothetical protein
MTQRQWERSLRARNAKKQAAATDVGRVAAAGSGSFRVGNAGAINAKYCKPRGPLPGGPCFLSWL